MSASAGLEAIEREVARANPALLAAAREVDETLLEWALSLSPFERLAACSRAAEALARIKRATPEDR